MPLSFKPSGNGFAFGLPDIQPIENTIFGAFKPAVTAGLESDDYKVTRYDELSVTLRYTKAGNPSGELTIAEGSPYLHYRALAAQTVQLPTRLTKVSDTVYTLTTGGQTYAIHLPSGATITGSSLSLPQDSTMAFYAVSKGMSASEMASYAGNPIRTVLVAYGMEDKTVQTTLKYETSNGQPTLFAALPNQQVNGAKALAGQYTSLYGTLKLYVGTSFSYKTTKVMPSNQLSLQDLSQAEKDKLIGHLRSEAAATMLQKTDSYFGGKELYRAANLYALAQQLGQKDIAKDLHDKIQNDFAIWLDPKGSERGVNRYFYYDTTLKGLVAAQPSFGSEQFNDHHFHYGYFLYAASVMARYDHSFQKTNKPFLDLIAADIASTVQSQYFPQRRNFDPYFGHSWASGNGKFGDGNNQESVSEAINAWNGVAMWAQASGNSTLKNEATWMLSREADAAEAYWLDVPAGQFPGYKHNIVALNWGGKRDFATFFSPDANAMLGIQLIPMNPAMGFLKNEGSRITANITSALPGGSYDKQFGDYLLMYRSLVDKNGALPLAESLNTAYIDDANSRTYMLAWILSQNK
jgi:endoglucanase Acf2